MALPILVAAALLMTAAAAEARGVRLADLAWPEAERLLTADRVVVVPLGAAAKEHGPHLRLDNDWQMAEYLTRRVIDATEVVVAPTLNYHFYPAFVEYPGSTTLKLETARDLVVDICKGLSRFGSRRFYILNTGISTLRALAPARAELAKDGVLLAYTDLVANTGPIEAAISKQAGGTHADEIETSMMLYMTPDRVDMRRAVKDYDATGKGPLTRIKGGKGTYSPTGVWGDATLATVAKGKAVVEALVAGILADIEKLRAAPLPAGESR